MNEIDIEKVEVKQPELALALQLIDQIAADSYDPAAFVDEEKERILAAIDEKIAGKQIVTSEAPEPAAGGQIIDLVDALRASLSAKKPAAKAPAAAPVPAAAPAEARERKGAKRAAAPAVAEQAPVRARARK